MFRKEKKQKYLQIRKKSSTFADEFVERNAFDLHIDILNRMQYCYLKIGADSSAVRMEMLKTLYPPTE